MALLSSSALTSQPHVLAIPVPAQGHITPLMRICTTLASHGFLITFVNVDAIHHRLSTSSQQKQSSTSHSLEPDPSLPRIRRAHISIDGIDLADDFRLSMQDFNKALQGIFPAVDQLLEQLSRDGPPVTCLISDILLAGVSQKIADSRHLRRISVFTSSQSYNLFYRYLCSGSIDIHDALQAVLKQRDEQQDGLFHEALPGLPSLRIRDLPIFRHLLEEDEFLYPFITSQCKVAYDKAHAIVVNSFEELEGPSLEAFRKFSRLPVYAVGPLVEDLSNESNTSLWEEEASCLEWLHNQALQSVLYISFGSLTLLSKLQFEELLRGFEASNQKFLWAFRPDLVKEAAYTSLPAEFLQKTKDRGCIVRWAPQARVLSHPSVGGFLTHCGWNSTIEGIASGVPMLCWPYFADQLLDAKYIVEEWKIGLRFEEGKGGFVSGAEVEKQVKELMEGEEGKVRRKNALKLRDAARTSLLEGGSSHRDMKALVEAVASGHW